MATARRYLLRAARVRIRYPFGRASVPLQRIDELATENVPFLKCAHRVCAAKILGLPNR